MKPHRSPSSSPCWPSPPAPAPPPPRSSDWPPNPAPFTADAYGGVIAWSLPRPRGPRLYCATRPARRARRSIPRPSPGLASSRSTSTSAPGPDGKPCRRLLAPRRHLPVPTPSTASEQPLAEVNTKGHRGGTPSINRKALAFVRYAAYAGKARPTAGHLAQGRGHAQAAGGRSFKRDAGDEGRRAEPTAACSSSIAPTSCRRAARRAVLYKVDGKKAAPPSSTSAAAARTSASYVYAERRRALACSSPARTTARAREHTLFRLDLRNEEAVRGAWDLAVRSR